MMLKKWIYISSFILITLVLGSACITLPQGDAQSAPETIEVVIKGANGEAISSEAVTVSGVESEDGTYTVELELEADASSESNEAADAEAAAAEIASGEMGEMVENSMGNEMSNTMDGSNNMMNSMAPSDNEMMAAVDPTVVEIDLEIPVITNFPDDEPLQTVEIRRALELLVIDDNIALVLGELPEWHIDGWFSEEEGFVGINFYNHIDEWIGYGEVLVEGGEPMEILEAYMPRDLTPEEYQAGLAVVEPYVLQNPEVNGVLGDPAAWERYTYYDKWDSMWTVSFVRGLDALEVLVGQWEGEYYVEGIFDPNALEAEDQLRADQDLAVSIAYEADGINDAVFAENENWTTVASLVADTQYGVSFVADGEELYFVLVDITTAEILETR